MGLEMIGIGGFVFPIWEGFRLYMYLGKANVVLARISEHLDRFLVLFGAVGNVP